MSSFVDKKWRKRNEMFSYLNGFVCMPKSCMDPEAKTKEASPPVTSHELCYIIDDSKIRIRQRVHLEIDISFIYYVIKK